MRFYFGILLSLSFLSSPVFAASKHRKTLINSRNAGVSVAKKASTLSDPESRINPPKAPFLPSSQSDVALTCAPETSLKRRLGDENSGIEALSDQKLKKPKMKIVSQEALDSPEKGMKSAFEGVRKDVARSQARIKRLDFGDEQENIMNSPSKLKRSYEDTFPTNHFTHSGTFQGVPYYLDLRLFDPQQVILKVGGLSTTVETNLERMQRGCSPFSYKVAPTVQQYLDTPIMVGNPDYHWGVDHISALNKQQIKHRLDLHHLAKTMEDGITPLPSHFHHGTDFGVVVKDNKILAYGVSKKDARPFLKDGANYFADCLHPNFGDSKIDRKAFTKWRQSFWKFVVNLIAEEKENGTYNPFSPEVSEVEIFSIPSSLGSEL